MTFVLVYQMGKVGSSTVVDSLVEAGFSMLPQMRVWGMDLDSSDELGDPHRNFVVHSHDYLLMQQFLESCSRAGILEQVVVVSLIREFLPRNISAFFQNCDNSGNPPWYFGTRDQILAAPIEDLLEFFRKRHTNYVSALIKRWPKRFNRATGFPVLEREFDSERGVGAYQEPGRPKVFFCQTEKLNDNWDVLRRFLGLSTFAMTVTNEGSRKWYADIYRDFKRLYRPSQEELTLCYDNPIMRHFYSEQDLARFRAQWNRSPDPALELSGEAMKG
jgi:hypothetical protein